MDATATSTPGTDSPPVQTPTHADTPATPALRMVGVLAARPVLILVLGIGLIAANLSLLYVNSLVVIVDVIALGVLALAMRAEGRSLRDLFGSWRWIDLAWGALLLPIVIIGFLVSTFAANLIVYGGAPPVPAASAGQFPLWAGLLGVLVAPLTIAVAEEAVYRGYAQPRLQRRIGRIGALVLVAVVFGIQHIGFSLTSGPDVAAKVITTVLAGLMLGGLWLWLRRLMPLILAHWGLDVLFLGLPTLTVALL